MHGPPLVGWLLLTLGVASGAYCAARARAAPPGLRRAACSEASLGWGMAVMALPAVSDPGSGWWPSLTAVVGGAAAVPALLPRRCAGRYRGRLHHTVEALAMVYMSAVMAVRGPEAGHGHPGHDAGAAGPAEALTAVLLAYFTAYAVRAGVRLAPVAAGGPGTVTTALSRRPEVAAACRLAMSTGMCVMLLTM